MTFRQTVRSRALAAGIHISLSSVVFCALLATILLRWYPDFHFKVDGGWQGVRLMAFIDLVLGPLLTFIVFNPAKARRLIVLDLSIIATLQIGAMLWGVYAVHSQRPVSVNWADGSFRSITAEPLRIEKTDPDVVLQYSDRRPPLVYVRAARDDDEGARKQLQEIIGGLAEHEDPFFFEPFASHWPAMAAKAIAAEKRSQEDRTFRDALPAFLARRGGSAGDYRFFPYRGRYGTCTLAFTPEGALVDAVGCDLQ